MMAMNEITNNNFYVYNLICEDASHLGGPMGTEYTTHVFTKSFTTPKRAKQHAEEYVGEKIEWTKRKTGEWSADARTHIFHIKGQQVL